MKKIALFLLVSALMVAGLGVGLARAEDMVIASEEWAGATNADGSGLYWDLFRKVFTPQGYTIKPMMRSYEGSVQKAQKKEVDAAVGLYAGEVEGVIHPQKHFATDVVAVVYPTGTPFAGEASLANKKCAWIKGYDYDSYLDVKVRKMEFEDRKAIGKALQAKRVDFYLDATSDVDDAIKNGELPAQGLEVKELKRLNLFLGFADNERGKKLAAIFDQEMDKLIASGELKKLYAQYADKGFIYPY